MSSLEIISVTKDARTQNAFASHYMLSKGLSLTCFMLI